MGLGPLDPQWNRVDLTVLKRILRDVVCRAGRKALVGVGSGFRPWAGVFFRRDAVLLKLWER